MGMNITIILADNVYAVCYGMLIEYTLIYHVACPRHVAASKQTLEQGYRQMVVRRWSLKLIAPRRSL